MAVVDGQNKVSIQTVDVGEQFGTEWIIQKGLNPGERVVVEGSEKVRAGMQVNPKPYIDQAAGANGR
jgi:membrane fusion protein (multidrug efflux system)